MGWSAAIGWSYASKLDPAPTMAKYYNDTGSKKIIKEFYMYLGTGNASYTAGDALTGDGSTIEFYVSINGVESSHVYVNNTIGREGSAEGGYYPPVANTKKYTVQFTNGVEVAAGATVSVIGAYNATISYPNQVLVVRKSDDYVGGTVVSGSTYTISYDANGGTGAPASQTKQSGETLTLSTTKPTKSSTTVSQYTVTYNRNYSGSTDGSATARKTRSYSFSKWNTKSDGSGTSYNSGGSYTADANATLYAQYSSSDSGGSVTLPSYTRSGYTLEGWYTAASGGTKVGNSGASYTPTSNITLYAHWVANEYTITFDANGGSGAPSSQTKTHDVSLTLSSTKPTRTGYTFLGWSTSKTATSATYQAGSNFSSNANTTLYAVWKANTYTITYDANGGNGAPASQTNSSGQNLILTSNKPTTAKSYTVTYDKNGGTLSQTSKQVLCTFKEWNTSRDGSGTAYNPGDTYSVDASITLYAQWSDNKVGTIGQPERSNCIFVGWYTAKYNGTIVDENTIIRSNITIYAIWDYMIIYDANGGDADTVPNTQIKKHNTDIRLSSG